MCSNHCCGREIIPIDKAACNECGVPYQFGCDLWNAIAKLQENFMLDESEAKRLIKILKKIHRGTDVDPERMIWGFLHHFYENKGKDNWEFISFRMIKKMNLTLIDNYEDMEFLILLTNRNFVDENGNDIGDLLYFNNLFFSGLDKLMDPVDRNDVNGEKFWYERSLEFYEEISKKSEIRKALKRKKRC